MKVKEIMRTEYLSLQRDDQLEFILRTFAKNFISSAPVLDKDEFIGIISLHSIMKIFSPKKRFLFFPQRGVPIPELKRVIAAEIAIKPKVSLNPEQQLKDVVKTIVGIPNCIPVFEKNKKLVGIVRSEDLTFYFMRKLATCEEKEKDVYDISKGDLRVSTDIDQLLAIVHKNEWTPIKEIAKELGLSVKTAEKMGEVLRDHGLVNMRYNFVGGAELGRIEKEIPLVRDAEQEKAEKKKLLVEGAKPGRIKKKKPLARKAVRKARKGAKK